MSDTTPTSLEAILRRFYMNKRADQALPEAIAAIEELIPAKIDENAPMIGYKGDEEGRKLLKAWRRGRNESIDTIQQNFTGQTDNEREDSRI